MVVYEVCLCGWMCARFRPAALDIDEPTNCGACTNRCGHFMELLVYVYPCVSMHV